MNQAATTQVVEAEVLSPEEVAKGVAAAPGSQALAVMTPQAMGVARPVVTPAEASAIMAEYEALKLAVVLESDIRREKRGDTQIAYLKKSAWRKLATFFSLKVEAIAGSEKFEIIGGIKLAHVTYRATAPNGRFNDGDGHCGSDERGKERWAMSNLIATAHTRGYNRAVSNLVGGGEVSAEEADNEMDAAQPAKGQQKAAPKPAPKPAPAAPVPVDPDLSKVKAKRHIDAMFACLLLPELIDKFKAAAAEIPLMTEEDAKAVVMAKDTMKTKLIAAAVAPAAPQNAEVAA